MRFLYGIQFQTFSFGESALLPVEAIEDLRFHLQGCGDMQYIGAARSKL